MRRPNRIGEYFLRRWFWVYPRDLRKNKEIVKTTAFCFPILYCFPPALIIKIAWVNFFSLRFFRPVVCCSGTKINGGWGGWWVGHMRGGIQDIFLSVGRGERKKGLGNGGAGGRSGLFFKKMQLLTSLQLFPPGGWVGRDRGRRQQQYLQQQQAELQRITILLLSALFPPSLSNCKKRPPWPVC